MAKQKNFSVQSIILVNSIYPTKVAEPLLAKARASNGDAADFIIKYGLHKRLLGIKNAFSEEDDLVMLDDLEACNGYQLDLNNFRNLESQFQLSLATKISWLI